jgi:hypothetical protein
MGSRRGVPPGARISVSYERVSFPESKVTVFLDGAIDVTVCSAETKESADLEEIREMLDLLRLYGD